MTDDQHGEGTPQSGGRWDPLPQGDYDDSATAFVQLPEGGIDALLADRDSPLAAPGHGYVPPQITIAPTTPGATDPAATGTWAVPAEAVQWPDPNAGPRVGEPQQGVNDRFSYHPGATGQWDFGQAAAQEAATDGHSEHSAPSGHSAHSGHDVTGQWSIPVAGGDLPDESGEFTTSALVEQWGGTPPATLPGGAAAPWATEAIGQAWSAEPEKTTAEAPAEPPAQSHTKSPTQAAQQAAEPVHGAPEPAAGPDPVAGDPAQTAEPDPAPEDREASETAESAVAEEARDADTLAAPPHDEHPLASYVLRVNGADRPVTDAWIGESLLYVLRERLGLAGAKDGCSQGECGACNVQVDGRLVASCLVPAVTAAGSEVRTVEGLAADGQPSDVQRALAKCGAVQCGFCVPGMAMTVHDLLEGNPAPTELETRQALCGNLCRCSGYRGVLDAVREVVAEREAQSAADAAPDADEARIPHQAGPGAGGVHPSAYEDTAPYDPRAPHEQPYGQDGGQA
ncbi:2Fe-2S iron-sulfur cluster-binding protein [Streptomyces sp. NBC_00996]|uniref:2Fe-2S iron-sulfur cluster-binding protein n=1 Tax=Streptomyces sp. NBC_00996 TaxID=2903710 RepID=UPI00386F1914|nr:2Fe-2S iron-sulfur cluster-binding protein [Streptomyces sp. NBC_00996]